MTTQQIRNVPEPLLERARRRRANSILPSSAEYHFQESPLKSFSPTLKSPGLLRPLVLDLRTAIHAVAVPAPMPSSADPPSAQRDAHRRGSGRERGSHLQA